jgi:AraC-like DNA-binding protein
MSSPPPAKLPIDRLSALLDRFRVRAHLFHAGALCGVTHFAAQPGRGFLHVLRRGELLVRHKARSGTSRQMKVTEPSLLFYPRPLEHEFHNAPRDGSDFVCATLDFEGGVRHPLVQALPPVIALPLSQAQGVEQTLELLFAESDRVLCGHRLLADRLFEVLVLQLLRWLLDHPNESGLQDGLLFGLSDPRLSRALTALHERPGEEWSLTRMAEVAGMSRSAFASEFRRVVNRTPADYLLQWRASIAQSMLNGGASVKTTASELGYASAASFSRAFTQAMGKSPRTWLKEQQRSQ